MKKTVLSTLFCCFGIALMAQIGDTIPQVGFSFPLKSKITLQMVQVDSLNFNFFIAKYEPFDEIIDSYENDQYLSEIPALNTIELIFCVGTSGDNAKEKEKNYKTILLIKNGTKVTLDYKADMKRFQKVDFEATSVVSLFPNVKSMEMWPYLIEEIGLHDFKILGGGID